MGDYHTRTDPTAPGGYQSLWKFGTCEDWRYVRREQVQAVRGLDGGHQADVEWALGPKGAFFRFPWPDEDERANDPEGFDSMFRKARVRFGPKAHAALARVKHRSCQVTHEVDAPDLGSTTTKAGATTNLLCPYDASAEAFTPGSKGTWFNTNPAILIAAERLDEDGAPYTVFECGYCRAWFHLLPEDFDLGWTPPEYRGRILPYGKVA